MKSAKFINENPLAKVEHLIPMLHKETLLADKINETYKLLQSEIPLSDKKLLEIEVACFEYQYPFHCKVDSNNEVSKSILVKRDTLKKHIKRETRLNSWEFHYDKIQNYAIQETDFTHLIKDTEELIDKTENIESSTNPTKNIDGMMDLITHSFSFIYALLGTCASIIGSVLGFISSISPSVMIILVFVALYSITAELINTIFWIIIFVLIGSLFLMLITGILDSINSKKIEKVKRLKLLMIEETQKLKQLEIEKAQKKIEKIQELKQKEIELLKSKINGYYTKSK